MITQKFIKEILSYDPDTGVFVWRVRDRKWFQCDRSWKIWNTRFSDKKAGGEAISTGKTYILISIFNKNYKAHRLAWLYMKGSFPDNEIDHIDGCGTNNRLINLRDVTSIENHRNQRLPSNNKSGFVGVSWFKRDQKWKAKIQVDKKQIHLAYCEDWFEAVCIMKSAQLKYGFHVNHGSKRPL